VAQWADGKPKYVQPLDSTTSSSLTAAEGDQQFEGTPGSGAHPEGLNVEQALALAGAASCGACEVRR